MKSMATADPPEQDGHAHRMPALRHEPADLGGHHRIDSLKILKQAVEAVKTFKP